MDPILSVKNKNFSGNGEVLTKVLGADEETKTHLHWQFPRIWQSLWRPILVSLYVDTLPFRDKWCCWKSGKYAELGKGPLQYCCNQVWMRNGGRIAWSVTAIWGTYEISCLMGRHLTRGDPENHSKDQECHLVQWSNITLFLPKTCRDSISSASKSYQVYSSAHVLYAGGIWKGDTMVADIEELEKKKDASEIHAERLNAKEVSTPTKMVKKYIPGRKWNSQTKWRDKVLRTSSLVRDSPDRGEEQSNLPGESDGSSPPFQDSPPGDGEARNDFWSISGTAFTVTTLNRESNCTCREKHHSQFHWNKLTWPGLQERHWM